MSDFNEEWLRPYAVVPVDAPTTGALLREVVRLRGLLKDARSVLRLADRSAAWRAERNRVVAAIDNAALRIAPGSAGNGVPLKVPQGANGQAISDSREESGTSSNLGAAPT